MSTDDRAGDWIDKDLQRAAAHVHGLIDWLQEGTSPMVKKVLGEIREHFLEPRYKMAKLKKKLGLKSNFYILAFSTEVYAYTPWGFLRECRMLAAAYLLRDTPRSVIRVTMDVGYGADASFSNRFQEWCGLSPTTYRELARELLEQSDASPDEVFNWRCWPRLHRHELHDAEARMMTGVLETIECELRAVADRQRPPTP